MNTFQRRREAEKRKKVRALVAFMISHPCNSPTYPSTHTYSRTPPDAAARYRPAEKRAGSLLTDLRLARDLPELTHA